MVTYIHKQIVTDLTSLNISLFKADVLIAVSGGKDSLSLIKLIKDLQKIYRWKVGILHCNHQWRIDSNRSAKLVYQIAKNFNFSFYLGINNKKLLQESATREWRYLMFLHTAYKYQYNLIITAHTLSDKVETFFYNLSRGSLINGVTTLSFAKKITPKLFLYRPLISVSQSETLWLCRYFCLPVWSDSTNFKIKQKRNRIRHELLPYLRQYFNPKIDNQVAYFLEKLNLQNEYIKSYTRVLYSKIIHPFFIAIEINQFNQIHQLIQINILELIFKQIDSKPFQFSNIKSILNYLVTRKYQTHFVLVFHNFLLVQKFSYIYFCENNYYDTK